MNQVLAHPAVPLVTIDAILCCVTAGRPYWQSELVTQLANAASECISRRHPHDILPHNPPFKRLFHASPPSPCGRLRALTDEEIRATPKARSRHQAKSLELPPSHPCLCLC
jgi:hypothetical protein